MAPIDIPADYWTIRPRGFAVRAAGYSEAFRAIRHDAIGGAVALLSGADGDTRAALATVDGDESTIARDAFSESAAIDTAETGGVVNRYGGLDGQVADVDRHAISELPGDAGGGFDPPRAPFHPGDPRGPDDGMPGRGHPPGREPHDPGDDEGVTPLPSTGTSAAPPGTTSIAPPTGLHSTSTTEPGAPIMSADTTPASSAAPAVTVEPPAPVSADHLPVTRGELAAALASLDLTIHVVV